MEPFLATFFNPVTIAAYTPAVLEGMKVTLMLALAVTLAGTLLGLALAMLRTYRMRAVNLLIVGFADIGRALPPLVVILLFYFGLPGVGIRLSGPMVVFLVLALTLAAFAEEAFWAGFTSITRGQWEAGMATGLSFSGTLLHIALPQAVRLAVPPLVNRILAISKMTALGSVVGVQEILGAASAAQSLSGSATPLTMAAVAYLAVFLPVAVLARVVERRFAWKN
ncbi:amino acid ABC transporter permease [Aureimonas populi]|uniref:Amino acid ABC transporter permease n=1 Tax=Aureimonas populi TaxID=1701758 RepID=A0ABW5CHV1_9HYPH|nr:ABC transporter permease subunit [Aureimonas populi]